MSIEDYYQMIINVLIALTMITLILLFLYLVYGKEESTPTDTRISRIPERMVRFNQWMICLLSQSP